MAFKILCFFTITTIFMTNAFSHHGGASFNNDLNVAVRGKVTKFNFINPHVLIYIEVIDDNGETVEWSGELTSPNRLARRDVGAARWNKDVLQPGDEIILGGNPARNGAPFLRLRLVVDSEGNYLDGDENYLEALDASVL